MKVTIVAAFAILCLATVLATASEDEHIIMSKLDKVVAFADVEDDANPPKKTAKAAAKKPEAIRDFKKPETALKGKNPPCAPACSWQNTDEVKKTFKDKAYVPKKVLFNGCASCGHGMAKGNYSYNPDKTDNRPYDTCRAFEDAWKTEKKKELRTNDVLSTLQACLPHACEATKEYGACNAKCDGKSTKAVGTKPFTWKVVQEALRGGAACPAAGSEPCERNDCVIDVDCKGDKKYEACVPDAGKCVGGKGGKVSGTKKFTLTVTTPKAGNGKECVLSGADAVKDCECPTDCVANDEFGACGAPFICDGKNAVGKGKAPFKKRTIVTPASNGGKACPEPAKEKDCTIKCAIDCVETSKVENTCKCTGKSTVPEGSINTTFTTTTPPADGQDRKAKQCSAAKKENCANACELDANCETCMVKDGKGFKTIIVKKGAGPNGKQCDAAAVKEDAEARKTNKNPICVCLPDCALQFERVRAYFNTCASCKGNIKQDKITNPYEQCNDWRKAYDGDRLKAIKDNLPDSAVCSRAFKVVAGKNVIKSETKREAKKVAKKAGDAKVTPKAAPAKRAAAPAKKGGKKF